MRFLWLALMLVFCFPLPVLAVTTDITSYPSSITDEKFSVTVTIASASAGTNYLRVDLYKDGTKNYFGETDDGQSWYGGSDGKQYFPINIVGGSVAIATVSARLGEPSQTDYPAPGDYKIRIRRYTASGNQGSEDPISKDIVITKSWPSPSPSPTQTPSPSPTPTPTSSPTPSPTPKPSQVPSPTPSIDEDEDATVAGVSTEIDLSMYGTSPIPSLPGDSRKGEETTTTKPKLNQDRLKNVVYIGTGMIMLSVAAFFGYRKYFSTISK